MYITLEQILQLGILVCEIIDLVFKVVTKGKRK